MFKGKNVLVAGGTGVIGIPIVNLLVERGAKVTVAGMEPESKAHKYLPESATYIQRNFLDIEQCKNEIRGKQIVINLAGTKRSVGVGYKGISKFLVDMLRLQTNIMDISHEERVERFLFVGSICEYPPLEIRHELDVWNGKPQQNDWIPGVQKRIGESQAEAYFLDTGWDAVRIVRPSNVYGPYDNFNSETAQVIPAIISKLINQPESLEVIGDGSNIRDFIYSEDVAFWSLAALENAPANYPINLGSGEGVSIKEIVSKLVKINGKNTLVNYSTSVNGGDPSRMLSMNRAREVLGFRQLFSIDVGLRKTFDWALTNPNWKTEKFI